MKFTRDENASPMGTSMMGEFPASCKALTALFGEPLNSCDKVSTQWKFRGEDGSVVTLYEYKETAQYGDSRTTVKQFRARKSYDWHVGAKDRDTAMLFTDWLRSALAKPATGAPRHHGG